MNKYEMTSRDVVEFYSELERLGIDIWIDGGWGVDALLGKQTRAHQDLDIIIQEKDVSRVRQLLELRGYELIRRDDTSELNFKLGDDQGHIIDFTVIVFDEKGNGIYGPVENNEMNPADSFRGRGMIGGHVVRCVSPEYAIKFRSGYELRDIDRADIKALTNRFGKSE
jgi:lincosamide nucleotidyltransferase A/C/D/E